MANDEPTHNNNNNNKDDENIPSPTISPTPPLTSDDDSLANEKPTPIDGGGGGGGGEDEIKAVVEKQKDEKPSFDVGVEQSTATTAPLRAPTATAPGRVSLDVREPVIIRTPRASTADPPVPGMLRRSMSTVISAYAPLPFHLRDHKFAVALVVTIVVVDHGILPPVLYFALKYGTSLGDQDIFAIVTSVFGIVFGLDTCWRLYKLWRKDGAYRPEGSARWSVDYFQVSFCYCLIVNVVFIVTGTSINPPLIRMLALPMPLIIFQFSWQLLLSQFLRHLNVRTPFRLSSVAKGEKWPLMLYLLIEDVIAVDANGKNAWRRAWRKRYENSKDMRRLVEKLSLFWGFGGIVASAACVALIFGVDGQAGKEVGYALGWLGPWIWVIPASIFTTYYVKRSLKEERDFPVEVVEC